MVASHLQHTASDSKNW